MNFNKSLIALAVAGAMIVPALHAAEHTFSWGGNLRVESITETADVEQPLSGNATTSTTASVATARTVFGGADDESTTGGDTQIQLNYGYSSDDGSTTGSGFIRFASDRQIRLNIEASSEGDVYAASMKAEWEQLGWDGAQNDVVETFVQEYEDHDNDPNTPEIPKLIDHDDDPATEDVPVFRTVTTTTPSARTDRDQFATLTHKPTGIYFKIGREEWFGNEKGYTTDFLSQTKGFADTGTDRVAGHVLGWTDSDLGLDLGLFIQRDNTDQASARPFGVVIVNTDDDEEIGPPRLLDVNGFGLIAKYASGPVDVELIAGSATAEANTDRVEDEANHAEHKREAAVTQLHLAVPFGQYTPFLNFGDLSYTLQEGSNPELELTESGRNLGVSIGFGFADLVVAYGTKATENSSDGETTRTIDQNGLDLMFATNQDPLLVSLAFTTSTKTTELPNQNNPPDETNSQFGVRLDYGF